MAVIGRKQRGREFELTHGIDGRRALIKGTGSALLTRGETFEQNLSYLRLTAVYLDLIGCGGILRAAEANIALNARGEVDKRCGAANGPAARAVAGRTPCRRSPSRSQQCLAAEATAGQ